MTQSHPAGATYRKVHLSGGTVSSLSVLEGNGLLKSNTDQRSMHSSTTSLHEFGTMRPIALSLSIALVLFICFVSPGLQHSYGAHPFIQNGDDAAVMPDNASKPGIDTIVVTEKVGSSRLLVLVSSLTVFVLSIFIGFEIIAKVPPTLHTPLMSGSNAISGITVVGAIIASGYKEIGVGSLLGMIAIVLAMINVVGGFLVTHRMLLMFKKR